MEKISSWLPLSSLLFILIVVVDRMEGDEGMLDVHIALLFVMLVSLGIITGEAMGEKAKA
eukprot:scaffold14050_cov163-Cylindrotheca_fusiformis.AAC.1